MIEEGASDLHVCVGTPPVLRLHGRLVRLKRAALEPKDTESLAGAMASISQLERVNTEGSVDFGVSFMGQRFRTSVYRERTFLAMAVRLLPERMRTLDEIGIPEAVRKLLTLPKGLILLTGPTGSGKTTSLASMLNWINENSDRHILTIEDPIEYLHEHKKGLVNQREVGTDVPNFLEGIRRGLRQDPDVILVGEMRDHETMEAAVTAAETGHLIFSTLHTTGATRTVDRIIDSFPSTQQEQIRVQLAGTLRAAVSQILLPTVDGKGRVAAFEVMLNTSSTAALIRENKTYQITTDVQTGAKHGMIPMEQSLVELHAANLISYDEVLTHSSDPELAAQLAVKLRESRSGLFGSKRT